MNTANIFHTPLPFYAAQTFNPVLNSRISANHDKVERLSANRELLIKMIVYLLQILFYTESEHTSSPI
jgi:hypothetical protein